MLRDVTHTPRHKKASESSGFETDWSNVVDKKRQSNELVLVRVTSIDELTDRDVSDVRVGDELFVRDVTVKDVKISLPDVKGAQDEPTVGNIVIPVTFGGKYRACPYFSPTHIFTSVQELMDVYPAVADVIFPKTPFTVEGRKICAWDRLQVVTVVQGPSSTELLEVKLLKSKEVFLLPSSLKVEFLQWKNWNPQDHESWKPRCYSLLELADFWSPEFTPMLIELGNNSTNATNANGAPQSKESLSKRIAGIFKTKDKPVRESVSDEADEEFWIIPETWRSKKMILEPIKTAYVTNANVTSIEFDLPGYLKMKVIELSTKERTSSTPDSDVIADDVRPRSHYSSESSVPLNQLDLMSLRTKDRRDAIVAVVTSGANTASSRHSSSLAFGSWVALHRTRRIRKLLMTSPDSHHFLVSAQYGAGVSFTRLPLIFDCAGEAPVRDDAVYVTRCTSYPVQKDLSSCHEGQFVRFSKLSDLNVNNTSVKVVHCMVSSTVDGQQHSATFPVGLRGRFERVDESATEITTQDLFRQNLPVCVRVNKPDMSLGYDPLDLKPSFMVKEIITETTVIVETLHKSDDAVKSAGVFIEQPVNRGSLTLREVPTKQMDEGRGIDPYLRRSEFYGLQKLPCVERLAERDVIDLQETSHRLSASLLPTSPTEKEPLTPNETSSLPHREREVPQYAVVVKKSKGKVSALSPSPDERSPNEKRRSGGESWKVDARVQIDANTEGNYRLGNSPESLLSNSENEEFIYDTADDICHLLGENNLAAVKQKPVPLPRKKNVGNRNSAELPSSPSSKLRDNEFDYYMTAEKHHCNFPQLCSYSLEDDHPLLSKPVRQVTNRIDASPLKANAKRKGLNKASDNTKHDSDYDDVEDSENSEGYEDVEEWLSPAPPSIPPKPKQYCV